MFGRVVPPGRFRALAAAGYSVVFILVVAGIWAGLLSPFTNSDLLAALGGAGFSVATIETYKTFFFPNRPRGKFAGKPVW